MLDSTMAGIGTLLLAAVVLFFVNPVIAIIPLVLAFVPLALKGAGMMFKHAAPPAQSEAGATGGGPSVPSTREASYDPRTG